MSEKTLEYFTESTWEHTNGKPQMIDSRLQLLVDGRHVETWELVVMESMKLTDWIIVFARYLARGEKFVSPNLPNTPIDELTRAELAQIKNSDAYKLLKHMKMPALKAASQSFITQATDFSDPN